MERKFEKSEKIFLTIFGIIAVLFASLLIPFVQNFIILIVEEFLNYNLFEYHEKLISLMNKISINGILVCFFTIAILIYENKNLFHKIDFQKIKIPIIIFAIVLAFFSTDYLLEFATDTYATYADGLVEMSNWIIKGNGRIIIGIIYIICGKLGFSIETFYLFSYILAIVNLSLSIIILEKIIESSGVKESSSVICSVALIINPFVIEYFMFIEKSMFFLGILFVIFSTYFFHNYLKTSNHKQLLFSFICLMIAVFTYQAVVALFILISIPLLFKYSVNIKKYITNLVMICVMYGICGITNKLFTVIVGSTKTAQLNLHVNLIENLKTTIVLFPYTLTTTLEIVPGGVWLMLVFITLLISILDSVHNSQKIKARIFHILILFLSCLLIPMATVILTVGSLGMGVPRIIYPLGSCAAVLFLDYLINSENKKNQFLLSTLFIMFLLVEFFSFERILVDRQKVTALDKYRIEIIGQKIKEYEFKYNEKIEYITFYNRSKENDEYAGTQYKDLFESEYNIIKSSFQTPWSNLSAINYYLGTSYKKGTRQEKNIELFKENTDTVLCDEQFVFDGNTLHLFVY